MQSNCDHIEIYIKNVRRVFQRSVIEALIKRQKTRGFNMAHEQSCCIHLKFPPFFFFGKLFAFFPFILPRQMSFKTYNNESEHASKENKEGNKVASF